MTTIDAEEDKTEVIRARVEPSLAEAVRNLQEASEASQSDVLRALLRRGILGIEEDAKRRPLPRRPLRPDEYAHHVAAFAYAIDDVLDRLAVREPQGAADLARALTRAMQARADDLSEQASDRTRKRKITKSNKAGAR